MNAKLKRAASEPVTPAEDMTDYLVDKIDAIMICCGIKEIVAQKYTCGFGSRLHVTMTPFEDAPPEIVKQGLIVKDALAQLLAVVNLTKLGLSDFTTDEMDNIRAMWASAVEATKHPRNTPKPAELPTQTSSEAGGEDIQLDLSGVTPNTDNKSKKVTKAKKSCKIKRAKKGK
jgi:hypothetical protein